MSPQITLLPRMPQASRFVAPTNPLRFPGGDETAWLLKHYRGNKPFGGMWTSTHTADDDYSCDWERGLNTNRLIQAAMPPGPPPRRWLITHAPDAKILTIASLADAVQFTREFEVGTAPLDRWIGQAYRVIMVGTISDWVRATENLDAIRLTGNAADEIAWAMSNNHIDTAFNAWHCESTFWARWKFTEIKPLK